METKIAFFAQDKDGNVWLMGERPEDEEGKHYARGVGTGGAHGQC
jgi:hypothetical protein